MGGFITVQVHSMVRPAENTMWVINSLTTTSMIKKYAFLRTNIYSTNWPASTELCSRQYTWSNELLLCGLMIHQTHLVTRGHRSVDGRANAQSLKYHIIYNKCTRMKTSFRACYKLWIIIIFIHIYPGTLSWVGFINLDEQTRVRHKTSTNSTFHQELTNITSAKDTVLIQYHWNAIKMTIKRYFLRTYEITPCGRRLVTRDPKSPNIF